MPEDIFVSKANYKIYADEIQTKTPTQHHRSWLVRQSISKATYKEQCIKIPHKQVFLATQNAGAKVHKVN